MQMHRVRNSFHELLFSCLRKVVAVSQLTNRKTRNVPKIVQVNGNRVNGFDADCRLSCVMLSVK